MRIGRYNFRVYKYSRDNKFNLDFSHKYWYLWFIWVDLWIINFEIEICRTDWNRCYKMSCKNYKKSCKHNMECNNCMDCYEKIE